MSRIGKRILMFVIGSALLITAILVSGSAISTNYVAEKLLANEARSAMFTLHNSTDEMASKPKHLYADLMMQKGFANAVMVKNDTEVEKMFNSAVDSEALFAAFYGSDGSLIWKSAGCPDNISYDKNAANGLVSDSDRLYFRYTSAIISGDSEVGGCVIGCDLKDYATLDNSREKTNGHYTYFKDNIRYATTIIGEDGNRFEGTEMDEAIAEKVIGTGETYMGQANLMGQKHYVVYEPMTDLNGAIVGAYFSGFSTAEADKAVVGSAIRWAIIGLVICTAACIICYLSIKRHIIVPTNYIGKIADEMKNGELSASDQEIRLYNDELGDLAKNIEATKAALNSYIEDISRVLGAMASGDFTVSPDIEYDGDFAAMKDSMEHIGRELRKIIGKINVSSEQVSANSAQSAKGSEALAEGTTRQAAAIQQLSASLNDVSNHVNDTASNADNAKKLSDNASDMMSAQHEYMNQMVESMKRIADKSAEIENVIKTIDDIAFQTNILALNAAVEAARAGAAGKGFAVVADEVRNLASKCAEAVKDTSVLIEAAVAAVSDGEKIAGKNAEALDSVIGTFGKTTAMIAEIATSAEEQALAIDQITSGIGDISEVVQQNSATAEEIAASCEQLNSQAAMLKNEVKAFKIR
ncbi:MAG: cache domain-containing protein [Oscillospiraceae bacterium]|nr:cache domain-containing protein [Oscillospiraceae bacterium]